MLTPEVIRNKLSPVADEVHSAIIDQHPNIHELLNINARLVDFPDVFGVFNLPNGDDGSHLLVMSTSTAGIERYDSRFSRVVKFDNPNLSKKNRLKLHQAYVFGHELAHYIQGSLGHELVYGALETHSGDEDYINSDEEINADYISVRALASTRSGKFYGLIHPSHPPCDWRKWGALLLDRN